MKETRKKENVYNMGYRECIKEITEMLKKCDLWQVRQIYRFITSVLAG